MMKETTQFLTTILFNNIDCLKAVFSRLYNPYQPVLLNTTEKIHFYNQDVLSSKPVQV